MLGRARVHATRPCRGDYRVGSSPARPRQPPSSNPSAAWGHFECFDGKVSVLRGDHTVNQMRLRWACGSRDFRSRHDDQSWVAALTTVLDVCALIVARVDEQPVTMARLTFAMARHAVRDLCAVFRLEPASASRDRLPATEEKRLESVLTAVGLRLRSDEASVAKFMSLRSTYEPYVDALSSFLLMPLPAWVPPEAPWPVDSRRRTSMAPRKGSSSAPSWRLCRIRGPLTCVSSRPGAKRRGRPSGRIPGIDLELRDQRRSVRGARAGPCRPDARRASAGRAPVGARRREGPGGGLPPGRRGSCRCSGLCVLMNSRRSTAARARSAARVAAGPESAALPACPQDQR